MDKVKEMAHATLSFKSLPSHVSRKQKHEDTTSTNVPGRVPSGARRLRRTLGIVEGGPSMTKARLLQIEREMTAAMLGVPLSETMGMDKCPECSMKVKEGRKTCPHCGAAMMSEERAEPTELISKITPIGTAPWTRGQTYSFQDAADKLGGADQARKATQRRLAAVSTRGPVANEGSAFSEYGYALEAIGPVYWLDPEIRQAVRSGDTAKLAALIS